MFSALFLSLMLQTATEVGTDRQSQALPTVEVRSQRSSVVYATNSSLNSISESELAQEAPRHPNEVLDRIPGAWITLGSGQEHLTAIRSPALTGPGACGAFMVLEDQIPTRPSGFCNVNQLFEVNIAQAKQIDVLRGPGTVTYGSNALHGAINLYTPGPSTEPHAEYAVEAATDNYYRGRLALSGAHSAFQANFTDADSFRDDEQFQHALANLQVAHKLGKLSGQTALAYARLEQDTAGFILGKNSYKNNALRKQNLNPGAFRNGWALRVSSRWNWQTNAGHELELTPYVRSSGMEFLQHFLPGTPLEKNGHDSAGVLFSWSNNVSTTAGVELEWAQGFLTEFQENALTTGSAFLQATRPQGLHYDYEVRSSTIAAWAQWQHDLKPDLELTAGLRAERLAYDYDNRIRVGNTRADGSVCGFGGCLYTRPADRKDHFTNFSPELGLSLSLNPQQVLYIRAARGYRAPQATELYRLQSGQTVAELDAETLDSLEIGFKGNTDTLRYEITAYAMRKQNFIFRDAEGFNISDGKTRHAGIESLLRWQATQELAVSANLSWAQHEYAFDRDLARGEVIRNGNEIDTAPPWLGGLRLHWQRTQNQAFEAEWVYQGSYFLDAANEHRYSGHSLLNLRAMVGIADSHHSVSLRLTNLLDERYAERADFAFGNYRYFPGAGRRISVEWRYKR